MTTFEKNIEIFGRFCPDFVEEVTNVEPKPPPSLNDKEAEEWFSMLSLGTAETLIVFGLGAGEYYSACKAWLREDPKHFLVFVEDDLPRIHHFLTTEQANEILTDVQVMVITFHYWGEGETDFKKQDFTLISKMFADTECLFTESSEYFNERKNLVGKLRIQIQLSMKGFLEMLEFFDLNDFRIEFTNFVENLFQLDDVKLFDSLNDKFENIPAIICGAGPSLAEQLPQVAKLKDRALIFGAGTGMNVLNAKGIFPHIGIGLDHRPASKSRVLSNYAFETLYLCVLRFNHEALGLLHGPKMLFRGRKFAGVDWFEDKICEEMESGTYSGITSTQASFGISLKLGLNPIIFLGLDLAFTDQKRYPEEVRPHPLEDRALKREYTRTKFPYPVQSVDKEGNEVITKPEWIHEADHTARVAKLYPKVKCYNATPKGLLIPYLTNESLENLVNTELNQTYDIDNMLHCEMELASNIDVNQKKIYGWLEELRQKLFVCLGLLDALLIEAESFPSTTYEDLLGTLKKETVYQYFLWEYDLNFDNWVFRDFFHAKYHPETLSKEELAVSDKKKARYRLIYLRNIVKSELEIIEKVVNEQQGKSVAPAEEVSQAPSIIPPPPTETGDKRQSFFPDGSLKSEMFYENDQLHGSTSFYSTEGTLLARGNFVHGNRDGENLQFYISGALSSIQRCRHGDKEGKQEYYYPSGKLKTEMHFKNGKLDGPVKLYFKNGRLKRELHFKEGLLHGKERMWDPNGQLLMDVDYENHNPIATAKQWFPDGTPRREITFVDSPEHFDVKEWDETGRLIYEKAYVPESLKPDLIDQSQRVRTKISDLKEQLKKMNEG